MPADDFKYCAITREASGITATHWSGVKTKNIVVIAGYFKCIQIVSMTKLFKLQYIINNLQYTFFADSVTGKSYSILTQNMDGSSYICSNTDLIEATYYINSCFICP